MALVDDYLRDARKQMLLSEEWILVSSSLTRYFNLGTVNERILNRIFSKLMNPFYGQIFWCGSTRFGCTDISPQVCLAYLYHGHASLVLPARYGSPGHKAMKQMPLQYVEIKNVKITSIGPKRLPKEPYRDKWLVKILNDPLKKTFLMAPAQYPPVHRVPG